MGYPPEAGGASRGEFYRGGNAAEKEVRNETERAGDG